MYSFYDSPTKQRRGRTRKIDGEHLRTKNVPLPRVEVDRHNNSNNDSKTSNSNTNSTDQNAYVADGKKATVSRVRRLRPFQTGGGATRTRYALSPRRQKQMTSNRPNIYIFKSTHECVPTMLPMNTLSAEVVGS